MTPVRPVSKRLQASRVVSGEVAGVRWRTARQGVCHGWRGGTGRAGSVWAWPRACSAKGRQVGGAMVKSGWRCDRNARAATGGATVRRRKTNYLPWWEALRGSTKLSLPPQTKALKPSATAKGIIVQTRTCEETPRRVLQTFCLARRGPSSVTRALPIGRFAEQGHLHSMLAPRSFTDAEPSELQSEPLVRFGLRCTPNCLGDDWSAVSPTKPGQLLQLLMPTRGAAAAHQTTPGPNLPRSAT